MKIKIKLLPQIQNYITKKPISKILTSAILFNSFITISNAGILSPDTRYETFKGDNLKIEDIIEDDKVGVRAYVVFNLRSTNNL